MLSQKNKQGWRNPWVWGLLSLVFVGVLTNARMVWNVVNHPTRLLDDNYSVRGHNEHDAKWVQQQAERSTLAWQAKLHSPQRLENDSMALPSATKFILTASPAQFDFELADKDGTPLQGGVVTVNAQWPGNPDFDFKSSMSESSAGRYTGQVNFSRAGNWDLLIRVQRNDSIFDMEQKVFVSISK
jgi:hypothetical protein